MLAFFIVYFLPRFVLSYIVQYDIIPVCVVLVLTCILVVYFSFHSPLLFFSGGRFATWLFFSLGYPSGPDLYYTSYIVFGSYPVTNDYSGDE